MFSGIGAAIVMTPPTLVSKPCVPASFTCWAMSASTARSTSPPAFRNAASPDLIAPGTGPALSIARSTVLRTVPPPADGATRFATCPLIVPHTPTPASEQARLAWPFVELFPSRLAGGGGGLSAGISDAFARLTELDRVVVFIDEVEEIAAARSGGAVNVGVVNELLKALVSFREKPGRLLICATNSVRDLDPAFLRHGRFDYVLPIGPPDPSARDAMWRRHLDATGDQVDVAELVTATEGFTPADINHAARTMAQQLFEQSLDTGTRRRGTTVEYLQVIATVRPTLTDDIVAAFAEDIETTARM
ncbi:MAG: ATP-binding protein [Nakamurella sp.]